MEKDAERIKSARGIIFPKTSMIYSIEDSVILQLLTIYGDLKGKDLISLCISTKSLNSFYGKNNQNFFTSLLINKFNLFLTSSEQIRAREIYMKAYTKLQKLKDLTNKLYMFIDTCHRNVHNMDNIIERPTDIYDVLYRHCLSPLYFNLNKNEEDVRMVYYNVVILDMIRRSRKIANRRECIKNIVGDGREYILNVDSDVIKILHYIITRYKLTEDDMRKLIPFSSTDIEFNLQMLLVKGRVKSRPTNTYEAMNFTSKHILHEFMDNGKTIIISNSIKVVNTDNGNNSCLNLTSDEMFLLSDIHSEVKLGCIGVFEPLNMRIITGKLMIRDNHDIYL